MTQCPVCKRNTRVGDGPEGVLWEHTMNYWSVWTKTPYIPCMVKDMNITEARNLAAILNNGFAPLG